MTVLVWSDALVLAQPQMDATHREFVALLAAVEAAAEAAADGPREALCARYAEFLAHTEQHFAEEDRWMATLGFAAENCHAFQHRHVLGVLLEAQAHLAGDQGARVARELAAELGRWFTVHATSMDAALAQVVAACGFDPATGRYARRIDGADGPTAPAGCGSAACAS